MKNKSNTDIVFRVLQNDVEISPYPVVIQTVLSASKHFSL